MRDAVVILLGVLLCASSLFGKEYRQATDEYYTPQLRLYFYACEGSVEGVEQALEEGAEIDKLSDSDFNALHYAIRLNRLEVVEFLIQRGANPNALTGTFRGSWKFSPITLATLLDQIEIGRLLLAAGADPELASGDHVMTAVSFALQENRNAFIDAFIEVGVDISNPTKFHDGSPHTPGLAFATKHGSLEQVRRLVEDYGVSVNPKVEDTWSHPLYASIEHGNAEVVKYLIRRGAEIHKRFPKYSGGRYTETHYPLELAAKFGRVEITRTLLDSGAKPVRNLSRDNDPVFLADALGYEQLLELYESYGYRSNYWTRLDADAELARQAGRRADSVPVQSLFSAKYLEGNWELPEPGPREESGFKIAIIGDDYSEDMTSLLTVEWSARDNIQVLERDEIDALFREHRLTRSGVLSGQSLNEFSNILGADFLLLVNKVEFGNKDAGCEFRLINARRGILLDSKLYQLKESSIESFCRDYVKRAAIQVGKFGADSKNLKFLSVVNVRADFGSLAGLQLERQAHRLLEYELSRHSDILLMQRRDLDQLVRENQLLGEVDDSFQAASGFIDARLALNSQRDGVESIHLRLSLKSGESLASSVALDGKDFLEALKIAIDELLDVEGSENVAASDTLDNDFEYLLRESIWLFNLGLHEKSLDFVRNAIALNDDKNRAWFHYLKCLNSTYPELPEHDRFSNPSDFQKVFLHEQERLYVLDKLYRIHLDNGRKRKVLDEGLKGFEFTIILLDAVSLHRRYGPEIRSLEEDYLELVRRRIVPLFSIYRQSIDDGGKEQLFYKDYDQHVGYVLRIARHLREVDEENVEELVEQVLIAYSTQYTDPDFWPYSWKYRYYNYPYKASSGIIGWMRDEEVLNWVVDYASPYVAYEFITELFYYDWMRSKNYSRRDLAYWTKVTGDLLNQMSFREKVLVNRYHSPMNNYNYPLLMLGYLSPVARTLPFGGPRGAQFSSRDHVAINAIWRMLYPKSRDKAQEMSGIELDAVQLKHTQSMFERTARHIPWADKRAPIVRAYIQQKIESGLPLAEEKSTHVNGNLPVTLWHPAAYGYEYYEPTHSPVYENGSWYVVGCDQRTREKRIKRHALFVINAETMETEIREIKSNSVLPFLGFNRGCAFTGGGYLYFYQKNSGKPIFCLELKTMRVKRISGYMTHRAAYLEKADVVDGKLYALVTPEDDVGNLNADYWSVLLISFDPSTARTSVIANSRRNPPENELDRIVKNAHRVVHSEDHGGILISFGRSKLFHWDIETGAANRMKSSSPPRVNYLDVEVRERYRELGFLTEGGHLWWKHHNRVGGKWERYAESGALLFTNWDVFPNLWKAVEFTFDTAGKQCPQFDVLNTAQAKDQISHKNFHHGVNRGYFVVNENVLAFFKTEDLAAALKESTLLPER